MRLLPLLAAAGVLACLAAPASARITRLEILHTEPAFGGQSFGATGPYEHITARAYGTVDPKDPANAIVQDLALAPRDAKGLVEYSTDVELLKPVDMARGNRMLFFDINNRGNKLALGIFNEGVSSGAAGSNALASPGDGWLMRQGYTMVWWGWEMDTRPGQGRMLMQPVIAHNPDGSPITGIVRSEMLTPQPTQTMPFTLSEQAQRYPPDNYDSYPTADIDNHEATLTVRAHEHDPRMPIPTSEWSFGTCADGPSVPDRKHLCYPAGFQPGRLYELIYRAKDPKVLGLGFIATRDLGAFLRNADADDSGVPNPVRGPGHLAIIMGSSQSGRMLRTFLALGFNRGEDGRQVFDGAFPHIGGGRIPLNVRFGQPVRAWGEQTDHLYPAYEFPFSYARQKDPLTGRTQGLLDRCVASNTCPRIFHVATSLEMWEGRQSLGFTDPLGRYDIADPPQVRTFIMASTQHGPAKLPLSAQPPFGNCQEQPNPNPQIWTLRALMTDFTAWVRDGVEPPPSTVPGIADGTLVAPGQVHLPVIPATDYGGVPRPAVSDRRLYNPLHVLDFGPEYNAGNTSGIITIEPPRVGTATYGVLEPQVDKDGNDLGGIRSAFEQVPIGTYLGWNLFRAGHLGGGMCNLQGSFIPFAATRAEREAAGDPRLSLEERYPTRDSYVEAFRAATDRLVQARFLLPEDAARLNARAVQDGIRTGP